MAITAPFVAGQVTDEDDYNTFAWGRIAESTLTTDISSITTATDIVTVTFTAVAGRRYKITGQIPSIFQATGGQTTVTITDNTPTVIMQKYIAGRTNNSNIDVDIWTIVTPSAGSVTYRLRVAADNAVTVDNNSAQVTRLLVEDIGSA